MQIRFIYLLVVNLIALALLSACSTNIDSDVLLKNKTNTRTLIILPLGDSITQGGRNDRPEYTYRFPLAKLLETQNIPYDFVGSINKGLNEDATWPDINGHTFDNDNEGHYGWKTAAVLEKLPLWSKSWQATPDMVLIHLGTNDLKTGDFNRDVVLPLHNIIEFLRGVNPDVHVFLGHLNYPKGEAADLRELVEVLAKKINTPESPVITVHHYQGFEPDMNSKNADTFDWAHPNPKGQQKMADHWFAAMKPYLSM